MKRTTIRLGVVVLFAFVSHLLSAQSLVGSAGGSLSSNTYNLSWSLGELATTTLTNSEYTLSQGLLQGIKIDVLGLQEDSFQVSVFPNPTSKWIEITNSLNQGNWSYRFVSQEGKQLLYEDNLNSTSKILDLSSFNSGVYLLQVTREEQARTLRIIINH